MSNLLEKLKWKWTQSRQISQEEYNNLVREYYDLRFALIQESRNKKDMWKMEWLRLVRDDRPRPHSYQKFVSIKMNDLARDITKRNSYGLNLAVEECGRDNVRIYARAKRYPDVMIGMVYYDN